MRRSVFLLVPMLLFATPAVAKTRIVPRDFATIQEAVDASKDGDKVIVRKGTYAENVVIRDLHDFKIKAENKPVIDPEGVGTAITVINCRKVKIRNFRIRNAGVDGVELVDCEDVQLKNVRVRDCGGTAVAIRGGKTFDLLKLKIEDCGGDGIYLGTSEGEEPSRRANVQKCTIENVQGFGVHIDAQAYHSVRRNRIYECGWGVFFGVGSESSRADRNRIEDCVTGGASVNGTRNLLRRNRIRRSGGDGVIVLGEECRVEFNQSRKSGGRGLVLAGRECIFWNNKVFTCEGDGLVVLGPDNLSRRTEIEKAGGRGVVVGTTGTVFRRNKARKSGTVGWYVVEGAVDNLFRKVKTKKSGEEGLVDENPAGSNTYEKSSFK
jgi:nitrous oxidase accessory protein NosD